MIILKKDSTHTESLKKVFHIIQNLNIDVFSTCSERSFDKILPEIKKYHGLIWGVV